MTKSQLPFMVFKITTDRVESSEALGEKIGRLLQNQDVISLNGPLGAGKTALTRGIARGWGTLDRVTSPTYTLVNEYRRAADAQTLFHLDCYRLSSADDAETIGLDDILAAEGAVIIEWAERIAAWLPLDHVEIRIEQPAEEAREFSFIGHGLRSRQLIEQLQQQSGGGV